ncbi:MAG: hypothetical protein ACI977_000870 [Candidatus Nanohaloarchaea archaeon]|jgi:hypothetical protein
MALNLERNDYLVMVGLAILSAIAGVVSLQFGGPAVEGIIDYISMFVIVASLAVVYKARELWGGEISRALELIGAGLAVYMITYLPHINWHLGGGGPLGPLPENFLYGFFHALTLATFVLVGYGFYTLWESGK